MGLKPNKQNEEQTPGEGSNRAARLSFIVLVQAHYWQDQSACGEATLRNLTAANWGVKRRPFGRRDGTNRGRLDEHQGSKVAGLSPSQSQASSSTRPHQGTPATQRPPPRSHTRRRPPQPRASRFAIQNPMPQPPAAAKNSTHPSARVRPSRTCSALAPGDTLLHRRRGLRRIIRCYPMSVSLMLDGVMNVINATPGKGVITQMRSAARKNVRLDKSNTSFMLIPKAARHEQAP